MFDAHLALVDTQRDQTVEGLLALSAAAVFSGYLLIIIGDPVNAR